MKNILLIASIVVSSFGVFAQNGKIISQEKFMLSEDEINRFTLTKEPHKIQENVSFYKITYLSDGLKVKGYMSVPNGSGKYPCLIYNRGGGGDFGKLSDFKFVGKLGEISNAGYVVVASQYRGSDGGEGKDEYGGKEVNDVLNLIPLLTNIEKADTSRIGMYGVSRGGMETLLASTKTERIKALIVHCAPTDMIKWTEYRPDIDEWMPNYIDNYLENKQEELKRRSAIYFAGSLSKNVPILVLQGGSDNKVDPRQSFAFTQKLYELQVPFRFVFYVGGNHGLTEHWNDQMDQKVNWLDKYVRDEEQWPSLEPHD